MYSDHVSSMFKIEDKLVVLVIEMAHIRYLLSPFISLQLASRVDKKKNAQIYEMDRAKWTIHRDFFM